ncbi:MAG: dodecin family protein [Telluria sp.]|nr:dodecin family protein [Telluria sp.]
MPNELKVMEVPAESATSWEDAAAMAVATAARTVANIKSIRIRDFEAQVDNNKITSYRVNANVSFMSENPGNPSRQGREPDEMAERNVQESAAHGAWQDDALKGITKHHPQRGIEQVESLERQEAPPKE